MLKKLKIDYLYTPSFKDIYGFKPRKKVFLDKFSKKLCGKFRKGHFEGVLNVMNRFIEIIEPKYIYLGKKDYQQLYLIKKQNILGHSDIAPNRKKDPGEKFPWKELAKVKLAHWHQLNEKELIKYRLKKINSLEEKNFFINLHKIGYIKVQSKSSISKKRLLIKAFQRRFRQGLINGISDQECLILSKNLIKS